MKIYIVYEQAEFVEDSGIIGVFLSEENARKRATEVEESSDPFWGKLFIDSYEIEDWNE